MLEEIGYEYKVINIDLNEGDQFKPEFKKISPFSKIPVIIDHSNDKKPPKGTILLSKEIPSYGGDTQFVNMNLLYENLSNEMKNKIKKLNAKHVYQSKFSKRKLMSIKNQDHKNR